MTTFLPEGYESLKTEKAYWKMSQMKEGDNKLRIVAQPIAGWLDWHDKKPMRYRPSNKPSKPFDAEKPIKSFWTCYVWDYAREGLYVLEITQSSIQKALTLIAKDEDWGDFTKYDVKITKEGTGKETRYSLTPLPHKPLSAKIEEALKRSPVRLEALYEGGDPWTDLIAPDNIIDMESGELIVPSKTDWQTLEEMLVKDKITILPLRDFVKDLSTKKQQPEGDVVRAALMDQLYVKFKQAYLGFIEKPSIVPA